MTAPHATAIAFALAGFLSSPTARADTLNKEQCIDAHSRGQDAREQGKLSLARKLFVSCAQSSCPALVQGDCARFTDDLTRQQSSLSFVARDAQGADLPDTAVYVDGYLVVTRLDDGRPHDVDPGSHSVRFTSNGIDQIITLVVGTGEKGRVVSVSFPTINPPRPRAGRPGPPQTALSAGAQVTTHPTGSRYLIGTGGALVLTGAVLGVLGVRKVPSSCSISSNHCLAPEGDPAFDQARSGMQLVNAGLLVGTIGVATLTGGLVWYFTKARTERRADAAVIVPSVAPDAAGLVVRANF
jgi:hypothetical protein